MLSFRRLTAVLLLCSAVLGACGEGDDSQVAVNGPTTTPKPTAPAARDAEDTATTARPTRAAAAAVTVRLEDDLFDPDEVEIAAGETVLWRWEGKNPHNVSGDGFKSKIQTKGTFRETFDETGSFEYRCDVHPNMTGTVVVRG